MAQTRPQVMVRLSETVAHFHCICRDNKVHGNAVWHRKVLHRPSVPTVQKQPKHHLWQLNVQGFFELQLRKVWSALDGQEKSRLSSAMISNCLPAQSRAADPVRSKSSLRQRQTVTSDRCHADIGCASASSFKPAVSA